MLAGVARKRSLGDPVEQLWARKVGQPDAGDRQPGELGGSANAS